MIQTSKEILTLLRARRHNHWDIKELAQSRMSHHGIAIQRRIEVAGEAVESNL